MLHVFCQQFLISNIKAKKFKKGKKPVGVVELWVIVTGFFLTRLKYCD